MDGEKRKRADDDDGATVARKRTSKEHDGGAAVLPEDEEVEEFFEILKRIRVAVKYFQSRNGELTEKPLWKPVFERRDFDGAKEEDLKGPGLDLNSDPVDVAGSG